MRHLTGGGGRARAASLLAFSVLLVAGTGCYSSRFKAIDQSMYALQARADSLAEVKAWTERYADILGDIEVDVREVES